MYKFEKICRSGTHSDVNMLICSFSVAIQLCSELWKTQVVEVKANLTYDIETAL